MESLPRNISQWTEQDFENFVRGNSVLFRSFIRRFVNEISTVDDIVQEVLLKLWRDRNKLDHIVNYRAFTITMLRNQALNHLRSQSNLLSESVIDPSTYDVTDFFNDLVSAQTTTILVAALNSLPANYAQIMTMTLYGYANDEIADKLNLSLDSVKSIKKRSIKKIKKLLPEDLLTIFCF